MSFISVLIIFCLNEVDVLKTKRCLGETSLHQQQFTRKQEELSLSCERLPHRYHRECLGIN